MGDKGGNPAPPYDTWPDYLRALPNDLIRSSLFGISGRDPVVRQREIFCFKGTTCSFYGIGYDQHHLDILVAIAHLARGLASDSEIQTTTKALLDVMGKADGGKSKQLLCQRIKDLHVGTLILEKDGLERMRGPLLLGADIDARTGKIVVKLNPCMRPLFDETSRTYIRWKERSGLRSDLDKWLHANLCSHDSPHVMFVDTYRRMTGSTAALKEFRRMLKESLARLQVLGLFRSFSIREDDKVRIMMGSRKAKKKLEKIDRQWLARHFAELEEAMGHASTSGMATSTKIAKSVPFELTPAVLARVKRLLAVDAELQGQRQVEDHIR